MLLPVIGLEIHLQLKTQSKMFCSCAAHEEQAAPNANICPICMGHPGTLPVPNLEAVKKGVLMGLALRGKIAAFSKFDRKHYFYPDLPKGYQISQYDLPIVSDGSLTIDVPGSDRSPVTISITRAHLEEDAAKSFHKDGNTYVDYTRGGFPLLETVTGPDFKSPEEAKAFLQELRLIARYLGVSDADMEKGHLRCDANISLREYDEEGNIVGAKFHPKTEVKNINSFRNVERALAYEIERQTQLWKAGTPPSVTTTRSWDDAKQRTVEMRTKEGEADYRYFPEPDIPPFSLEELAEELRNSIPELPAARRARFADEYALRPEDARALCDNLALANFSEQVFSEVLAWLEALPAFDERDEVQKEIERKRVMKLAASWLLNKLPGLLAKRGEHLETMKADAENFAELMTLMAEGQLTQTAGLPVLEAMLNDGSDPSHVMEEKQLGSNKDAGDLATIVEAVIRNNPAEAAKYKAGKKELLQFFVGKIMKETEGTADAAAARNLLVVELEK